MIKKNIYLILLLPIIVFGQYPGGVSIPKVWYKANTGVYSNAGSTLATDNTAVYQWNDQMATGANLLQTTSAIRPVYSNATTLANFNPTVTFTRANAQWMQYDPSSGSEIINRASGTIYSAGYMNYDYSGTGLGSGLVGFDQSMDFPGLHTSNNGLVNLLMFSYNSFFTYNSISTNSFAYKNPFVAGSVWENGNGSNPAFYASTTVSLNGTNTSYSGNEFANVNTNNAYRSFRIGGDTNWGSHNGQLNEILVYQNILTPAERNRVESYLAIKYGTTLSGNYVGSAGQEVWTFDTSYQHNILGIARDDNGTLYQKQSRSENSGQKLIIGASSTLANTNALNTSTLTDGQFLVVGDNGLKQSLNTPLIYTSGTNGDTNFRFEAIWKAQNTNGIGNVTIAWPKGIKNLYLVQSSDAVFDGTDTYTPMTSEVTVNGVIYNTATVTLSNGQYFTFAGYVYAPGGVVTAAWYRADDVSNIFSDNGTTNVADNSTVQVWNEFNKKTFPLTQATATSKPAFSNATTLANFNPTVTFSGGTKYMDYDPSAYGGVTMIDRSKGALFGTGTVNDFNGTFGFATNLNYPGLYRYTNKLLFYPIANDFTSLSNNTFPTASGNAYISGATWQNGAGVSGNNLVSLSLLGNHKTYNTGINNVDTNAGNAYNIFTVGRDTDYIGLTGQQNEMIVFANNLSDTEITKVESYLAVKYGHTFDKSQNRDYLNSSGSAVWDAVSNTNYYYNVFGIAKDNISALHQKVSKSINTGTILTVATNNDFISNNLAASRTALSNDNTYFLLGDNNNTTTSPLVGLTVAGIAGSRIPKIWLSQRTGTPDSLYFEADLSSYGTLFSTTNSVYMIVADDAAFTTNVNKVVGVYNSGKWVFNRNFNSDSSKRYITFAAFPLDSDDDGIADSVDLDDDNDGILDTVEGYTCGIASIPTSVSTTAHVMNYNFVDYNGIKGFNFKLTSTGNADRWASSASNFNMSGVEPLDVDTNKVTYEFDLPVENFKFDIADLDRQENVGINFYDKNGNRITNLVPYSTVKAEAAPGSTTFTTDATYGVRVATTRNSDATSKANYVEIAVTGIQISKVEATFLSHSTSTSTPEYYITNMCAMRDTDGDKLPDYLDLDSDNDGCSDAIEGDENVTSANLVTAGGSLQGGNVSATSGTYYQPVLLNLGNTVDSQGVPVIVNSGGAADIGGDQGQGIGDSENAAVLSCLSAFVCNSNIYLSVSSSTSDPTTLYSVNYSVTPYTMTAIGNNSHGVVYNAMGYNKVDNYIYAVSRLGNTLYKIGNDGNALSLGVVAGLPSDAYVSGDILSDGNTYIVRANATSKALYSINIAARTATLLSTLTDNIGDIAYNPIDNLLYSATNTTNKLISINPSTGVITVIGDTNAALAFGGMFATSSGKVFGVSNSGAIYQFNLTTGNASLIQNISGYINQLDATACISDFATYCYKPAATIGITMDTNHGITALGRAGADNGNWPMVRKGAWTALEAKTKGFVVNRIATTALVNSIAHPVEGMMVYDEEADCLKVYTTTDNGTTFSWKCMSTQACPN